MENEIHRLFVRIGADTADFDKAIQHIQSKILEIADAMTATGAVFSDVAGSIEAALVEVYLKARVVSESLTRIGSEARLMSLQIMLAVDSIIDMVDVLDINADRLRIFGTESGSASRAISDGIVGIADFSRGLEDLEKTIVSLNESAPGQAFVDISTALTGINTAIHEANSALSLYDRLGTDLIPALKDLRAESMNLGDFFSSANGFGDVLEKGVGWKEDGLLNAYQHVGIVTDPRVGLIGQSGPEAIIPLNQLGERDFGNTVVVNVGGSVVTERELTSMIRENLLEIQSSNVTSGLT